jgi:sarcosine oxidase subunit beta
VDADEAKRSPRTVKLPARAEVVIVGGGVIGTSIAFHLAEAGVPNVLVIERAELGSGSTGKAAGGVRAQFSDPLNIAIGLRSLEAFGDFDRRPGGEIDLHRVGYLFLLDDPDDVPLFERSVALQNELGVPSRLLTATEAQQLSPLAGTGGVLAASFCPLDGHASPAGVVEGYASGARRHGATVVTGCELTGVSVEQGRIRGVTTSLGAVETGVVVCAAGAWSRGVAESAGLVLPVQPVARQVWFTAPLEGLPESIPLTIDFTTGFYFHREGPGLLFGMADPGQPPGFAAATDPDWLDRVLSVAERRAPVLVDAGLAGGWTGYYEVSPDDNALVGEAAGVERFLYATGFSGHGFLQAPAVGEIVRDLVLGRTPFVDVAPLAVERFATGTRREHNVV